MPNEDGELTRAERLKKLYSEEIKDPVGRDAFKRRAVLETEYARESPDEPPMRSTLDKGFKRGGD